MLEAGMTLYLLLGAAALGALALIGLGDDDDDDNDKATQEQDETVTRSEENEPLETGGGNDVLYGGDSDNVDDESDLSEDELDDLEDGVVDGQIVVAFSSSGAGDDTIYGGDGRDWVLSGDGQDIMYAGGGDDFMTDVDLTAEEWLEVTEINEDRDQLDAAASQIYDDETLSEEERDNAIAALEDEEEALDAREHELVRTDIDRSDDNDIAYGGEGDDRFILWWGSDVAYGGAGDDYFDAADDATSGADTLFGGADDDWFELDNGDTATGGDGFDFFRFDGAYNDLPDLEEAPVVITDFNTEIDEAVYVVNPDEDTEAYIIPNDAEIVTVQIGEDVHLGADIPDEGGNLDGEIDFTAMIMQGVTKADVDAAVDAGRISTSFQ